MKGVRYGDVHATGVLVGKCRDVCAVAVGLPAGGILERDVDAGPLQSSERVRRKGKEDSRYSQRNEKRDESVANGPHRGKSIFLLPCPRSKRHTLGTDGACWFAPPPGPFHDLGS